MHDFLIQMNQEQQYIVLFYGSLDSGTRPNKVSLSFKGSSNNKINLGPLAWWVPGDLDHPGMGVSFLDFLFSPATNNSGKPLWLLDFSIPRSVCSLFAGCPHSPRQPRAFHYRLLPMKGTHAKGFNLSNKKKIIGTLLHYRLVSMYAIYFWTRINLP